jgi:twitching motility protein PilU
MNTFDQALYKLYKEGEISYDDAILHADSANEVRLMIKLGDENLVATSSATALNSADLIEDEDPGTSIR